MVFWRDAQAAHARSDIIIWVNHYPGARSQHVRRICYSPPPALGRNATDEFAVEHVVQRTGRGRMAGFLEYDNCTGKFASIYEGNALLFNPPSIEITDCYFAHEEEDGTHSRLVYDTSQCRRFENLNSSHGLPLCMHEAFSQLLVCGFRDESVRCWHYDDANFTETCVRAVTLSRDNSPTSM